MVVFGDWLTFEASSGHSRNCGIWDFIFPLSRLLLGSSLVCLALQYSMVQCWFYQCQLTITLNCSLSLQQGDSVTHKDLSKCSDIHKMFVMSFCWTGDNRRVITVFTFVCLYWAAIVNSQSYVSSWKRVTTWSFFLTTLMNRMTHFCFISFFESVSVGHNGKTWCLRNFL